LGEKESVIGGDWKG